MSSISGINNAAATIDAYTSTAKAQKEETTAKTDDTAVVYEKSSDSQSIDRSAIIAQLKADQEAYQTTLQNIVSQMMGQQGNAYGAATDMWKFLASGNFTVDAATKEQAQKDIADDGYWGVEQTSDRILDFAKALSGGDANKIGELRKAFEKGYKEATKAWGKDLPDISSKTYDAVMKKFDAWEKEANTIKDNQEKVAAETLA